MTLGIDDILTGGASAIGSIGSALFGNASAEANQRFQHREAQYNRDFIGHMSDTAYQRAVADMKKAGLNPMLLASKGFAPASTGGSGGAPSGATYQPTNPLSSFVSSATQLAMTKAQISNLHSQSAKNLADAAIKQPEAAVAQDVADGYHSAKNFLNKAMDKTLQQLQKPKYRKKRTYGVQDMMSQFKYH